MTEAWTRGGYYVQTSADVETATRIARAVLGHEPEVRRTNLRVGFLQADADQNLLAPVWFTCRAEWTSATGAGKPGRSPGHCDGACTTPAGATPPRSGSGCDCGPRHTGEVLAAAAVAIDTRTAR